MSPPCQFYLLPLRDVNWLTEMEIKSYLTFHSSSLSDSKQYCRAPSLMTPAARSTDNQDDILHVRAHDGRHQSGIKIRCFCFKLYMYIFKLNCYVLLQDYFRLQRLWTLRLRSQCVHNSRKLNCCPIHLRWKERTLPHFPPTRLCRDLLSPAIYIQMPWLITGRRGCWAGCIEVS